MAKSEEEAAVAWSRPEDGLERPPRKLLSSWVYQARPLGRPRKRWAESIEDDIKTAELTFSNWHEKANIMRKINWNGRTE
jgi:hypothetical protein